MAKNTKSIEEQVEDWCKKQFKGQKYYTKTETINAEIASALEQAPSKQGGSGKNYPDIKCLLMANDGKRIPVMIEVKGRKGDLIKTTDSGDVDNYNKKGDPSYQNIAKYAVNGAVHYAHAILNFTETYKEVVAIGVNGYDEAGKIVYEVDVWYISKANLFVPKHVGLYDDLSFLYTSNTSDFIQKLHTLSLTPEELEERKLKLEDEIERKLKALNQSLHDEQQIVVNNRVQLVAGLIMAGLGAEGVQPLRVEDLASREDDENNDGQVIMSKIKNVSVAQELARREDRNDNGYTEGRLPTIRPASSWSRRREQTAHHLCQREAGYSAIRDGRTPQYRFYRTFIQCHE